MCEYSSHVQQKQNCNRMRDLEIQQGHILCWAAVAEWSGMSVVVIRYASANYLSASRSLIGDRSPHLMGSSDHLSIIFLHERNLLHAYRHGTADSLEWDSTLKSEIHAMGVVDGHGSYRLRIMK